MIPTVERSGDNLHVARAIFLAGLLDEATLRAALGRAGPGDLARLLVAEGRVRREAVERALASGIATGSEPGTVLTPGPVRGHVSTAPTADGGGPPSAASAVAAALSSRPGTELPPGTRLGGYRLVKLLAKGGMGAVFVAEQEGIGRTVALKVLLAGEGATEEQIARFKTEARAAGHLSHPNVVPVYDVGESGGVHYLTMELVEGPSLRALIRAGGALAPRRALALVEQVARGVAAAHGKGIVHRDLKPENVLVAAADVAKVMDFGLAKEQGAGQGLTLSGAVLGTPQYMAPEQAAGEKVGPAADVWGLGAILYECLTGKPPFDGPTLANILNRIFTKDVVPPRAVRPSLSRDVETICMKALEKASERRYASAGDLADDAARWLAGEAIVARPPSGPERLRRFLRRRWAAVAGAAVVVLAVGATVAYFLFAVPWIEGRARARAIEAYREGVARIVSALLAGKKSEAGERPEGLEDLLAAVAARRGEKVQGLPPGAERPAFLEERAVEAALRLAHGERLAQAGRAKEAEDQLALAYAEEPSCEAGKEALARLALAREGSEAEDVLTRLLAQGVPEELATRLELARARRRLSTLDFAGAARDLAAVLRKPKAAPATLEAARRLASFVQPLGSREDLRPPFDTVSVSCEREPGEKAARLHAVGRDGAAAIYALRDGHFVVETAFPAVFPKREAHGGIVKVVAGHKVAVYHTAEPVRLVLVRDGTVVREVRKNWGALALRFVELARDPRTVEAIALIAPNDADACVLRLPLEGEVPDEEPLDPEGRAIPGSNTINYAWSALFGPFGSSSPRLLVGYGPYQSYRVRVLEPREGRLVPLAEESPQLGRVRGLAFADLRGDARNELVVAHEQVELYGARAPRQPRDAREHVVTWNKREFRFGLTLFAWDQKPFEEIAHVPALDGPLGRDAVVAVEGLQVLRLGAGPLAFFLASPKPSGDPDEAWSLRVARLSLPPEVVATVPVRGKDGHAIVASGDLDGDGADELVLLREDGRITVHGLGRRAEQASVAPVPVPPRDDLRTAAVDVLRSLGFGEAALHALHLQEERRGISRASEETALVVLAAAAQRKAPDEGFLSASASRLATPGLSPLSIARIHVLRAVHLTEGGDEASARAPPDVEGAFERRAYLSGDDRASLHRVRRVLRARGVLARGGFSRIELDFARAARGDVAALASFRPPKGEAISFVATVPVRVVLGPEGLTTRVTRRVRVLAGVPIGLPGGTTRVTVDFATSGRAWCTIPQVGLLREYGAGLLPEPLAVEGLACRFACFGIGKARYGVDAILGGASWAFSESGQKLLKGDAAGALRRRHAHRMRLHVTLEHDPISRWSRYAVLDRDDGRLLVDDHGSSMISFPPGPCIAGIYSPGNYCLDAGGGGNFGPDATVTIERIVVEHATEKEGSELTAEVVDASLASPVGGRHAAGRAVLLGSSAGAKLDETISAYEAAIPASGPDRARLLVQRAAFRARNGDPRGARSDLLLALSDPFGFFRTVEDLASAIDDASADALRRALRDAVLEANAELARAPGNAAALARRAVARRLRGENALALEDLAAIGGPDDSERAYVRLSAIPSAENTEAWKRTRPRSPVFPEIPYPLRPFWLPLDEVADPAAYARAGVARERTTAWLDRWIELAPRSAEAWRMRARFALAKDPQERNGAFWRIVEDLRRAAALDPADVQTLALLAQCEAAITDFAAAAEHLAALRQRGADVAPLVDGLREQYADEDELVEALDALKR